MENKTKDYPDCISNNKGVEDLSNSKVFNMSTTDTIKLAQLFFQMQAIKISNMSSAEYQAYKEKRRKRQES